VRRPQAGPSCRSGGHLQHRRRRPGAGARHGDAVAQRGDPRGAFLRLAARGETTALLARQRALEETAEGRLWLRLLGLTLCLFPVGGGHRR
jgi:hypothetical protein